MALHRAASFALNNRITRCRLEHELNDLVDTELKRMTFVNLLTILQKYLRLSPTSATPSAHAVAKPSLHVAKLTQEVKKLVYYDSPDSPLRARDVAQAAWLASRLSSDDAELWKGLTSSFLKKLSSANSQDFLQILSVSAGREDVHETLLSASASFLVAQMRDGSLLTSAHGSQKDGRQVVAVAHLFASSRQPLQTKTEILSSACRLILSRDLLPSMETRRLCVLFWCLGSLSEGGGASPASAESSGLSGDVREFLQTAGEHIAGGAKSRGAGGRGSTAVPSAVLETATARDIAHVCWAFGKFQTGWSLDRDLTDRVFLTVGSFLSSHRGQTLVKTMSGHDLTNCLHGGAKAGCMPNSFVSILCRRLTDSHSQQSLGSVPPQSGVGSRNRSPSLHASDNGFLLYEPINLASSSWALSFFLKTQSTSGASQEAVDSARRALSCIARHLSDWVERCDPNRKDRPPMSLQHLSMAALGVSAIAETSTGREALSAVVRLLRMRLKSFEGEMGLEASSMLSAAIGSLSGVLISVVGPEEGCLEVLEWVFNWAAVHAGGRENETRRAGQRGGQQKAIASFWRTWARAMANGQVSHGPLMSRISSNASTQLSKMEPSHMAALCRAAAVVGVPHKGEGVVDEVAASGLESLWRSLGGVLDSVSRGERSMDDSAVSTLCWSLCAGTLNLNLKGDEGGVGEKGESDFAVRLNVLSRLLTERRWSFENLKGEDLSKLQQVTAAVEAETGSSLKGVPSTLRNSLLVETVKDSNFSSAQTGGLTNLKRLLGPLSIRSEVEVHGLPPVDFLVLATPREVLDVLSQVPGASLPDVPEDLLREAQQWDEGTKWDSVALEFDGPTHFVTECRSDSVPTKLQGERSEEGRQEESSGRRRVHRLNGSSSFRRRCLAARGILPVSLPYWNLVLTSPDATRVQVAGALRSCLVSALRDLREVPLSSCRPVSVGNNDEREGAGGHTESVRSILPPSDPDVRRLADSPHSGLESSSPKPEALTFHSNHTRGSTIVSNTTSRLPPRSSHKVTKIPPPVSLRHESPRICMEG
uniref:RAP domain-containing protein n=1 Tax=Chromera velia CCMP2878 TaxID=1169474 RepID=A0A0G4F1K3_9ALVE|eukprot:Cvel_14579.t1-p1 / transcript=Cvel_14579.t1 / gene=Cvel_14579 / organism=Chromera_velia_CCMP2878 / gene_product=hypothetical protein / transcript_product=hypothetical protein / location=Cvel_scaffold1042:32930-37332(+) / protein_length=1046 / sequence_SO=supercontig / SO=protein_coding / is_pseudo=false